MAADMYKDYSRVFHALAGRECRSVKEIMEDTRLTSWVVQAALDELIRTGLIEMRERCGTIAYQTRKSQEELCPAPSLLPL